MVAEWRVYLCIAPTKADSRWSLNLGSSVGQGCYPPLGPLVMWSPDRAVQGKDRGRFLKHGLAPSPGNSLLIWAGLLAQRSKVVKTFLAQGAAKRLHVLQVAAYALELNPQEGVWNALKNVELKMWGVIRCMNCASNAVALSNLYASKPISDSLAFASRVVTFRSLSRNQ